MHVKSLVVVCSLLALMLVGYRYLPPYYNPLAPLQSTVKKWFSCGRCGGVRCRTDKTPNSQ